MHRHHEHTQKRVPKPHLAIQTQSNRLVLQGHEEGTTVQLIFQVQDNSINWGRKTRRCSYIANKRRKVTAKTVPRRAFQQLPPWLGFLPSIFL